MTKFERFQLYAAQILAGTAQAIERQQIKDLNAVTPP